MPSGSCLCGTVAYELDEPLQQLVHCHCSMCRKNHGALFGSFVKSPGLHWVNGASHVARYESSKGFHRCFCNRCGSVLPDESDGEEGVFAPAGGLDQPLDLRPEKHIFVDSKAPWYEIPDQLPQMQEYGAPAELALTCVFQEDRSNAHEHFIVGSCLCGDVTFRYPSGGSKLMMFCHCSRCRKVKGAAHAANVFVEPGDFEWLKGEESITVFDLPEAERFGNSFCSRCGSSVPRKSSNSPMWNIPVGSLDDDPCIGPKGHIYVGSKADWFEITDNLRRYEEMPADLM